MRKLNFINDNMYKHTRTHTHTHTFLLSPLFHSPGLTLVLKHTPRGHLFGMNKIYFPKIKFNVFAKRIPPFANAYSAIQPEHIYAS